MDKTELKQIAKKIVKGIKKGETKFSLEHLGDSEVDAIWDMVLKHTDCELHLNWACAGNDWATTTITTYDED